MTDLLELFLPVYCIGNLIFSAILSNSDAKDTFDGIYTPDNGSNLDFIILFISMFWYSNKFS